ncbi:hypothetical protein LINPERHAP2_LOCUS39321 [Linum perenne]
MKKEKKKKKKKKKKGIWVGGQEESVGGSFESAGESFESAGESFESAGGSFESAGESFESAGESFESAGERSRWAGGVGGRRRESSKYQQGQATPHDWLIGKNAEQWCKAFYRTNTKCEVALNNICECWNKYVLEPRSMPIISCLEGIRSMVMQRLHKKKVEMSKWEGKLLCQKPQKKLD